MGVIGKLFSPTQKTITPKSISTPFAQDYIKQLQGSMSGQIGNAMGLQNNAGNFAQQYLNSGALSSLLNASMPGDTGSNLKGFLQDPNLLSMIMGGGGVGQAGSMLQGLGGGNSALSALSGRGGGEAGMAALQGLLRGGNLNELMDTGGYTPQLAEALQGQFGRSMREQMASLANQAGAGSRYGTGFANAGSRLQRQGLQDLGVTLGGLLNQAQDRRLSAVGTAGSMGSALGQIGVAGQGNRINASSQDMANRLRAALGLGELESAAQGRRLQGLGMQGQGAGNLDQLLQQGWGMGLDAQRAGLGLGLQGAGLLSNIGAQQLNPFAQLAQSGIAPSSTAFGPSPFSNLLGLGQQAAGIYQGFQGGGW